MKTTKITITASDPNRGFTVIELANALVHSLEGMEGAIKATVGFRGQLKQIVVSSEEQDVLRNRNRKREQEA